MGSVQLLLDAVGGAAAGDHATASQRDRPRKKASVNPRPADLFDEIVAVMRERQNVDGHRLKCPDRRAVGEGYRSTRRSR